MELVARARDCHVKQAPLFLQRSAGIERATAWEHAVSQPDHEYRVKFQTFCLVHAGEVDRFFVCVLNRRGLCIDIADQCQLREKFMYVFELTGEHGQLVEVFPAQLVIRKIHFRVVIIDRFHN